MDGDMAVSVVMPVYNAAGWLPGTLERAAVAFGRAGLVDAEFLLVDDGSSDGTPEVVRGLSGPYPIRLFRQPHRGRFLTRKFGISQARYDHVLLLDARVHLDEGSIEFLVEQMRSHPWRRIWNGHVVVAKEGNIIARFGDAITFIGWRRYFRDPRTTSYGAADFDYYPKGFGCFFAPKAALVAAMAEFDVAVRDMERANDDTPLIRALVRNEQINLSPRFACVYHSRGGLLSFIRHTYHRGQVFVDGFMHPGTRFYRSLLCFLAATAAGAAVVPLAPRALPFVFALLLLAWIAELIGAVLLRVPAKDAWSLFILSPIFALFYGLGIWRAVVRRCASMRRWNAASSG